MSKISVELNKTYQDPSLKNRLTDAVKNATAYSDVDGPFIYSEPFFCCHLPKFIENETFLTELKDELLDLTFYEKNNDLYKFHQSDDLKETKSPYIAALRKFLYTTFREWVQDITGLKLSTVMDMNCARYDYTDVLLCHDDMLEGRKIAYIMYLVPPWKESDGGSLDLFSTTENGEPSTTVAKSLIPQWNSLAFFEVSRKSFHQVSEVLTEDKTRLSISGWFYGDPAEHSASVVKILPIVNPPISMEEELIYEWINPSYLDPETQLEIRHKFEVDSEVELVGFLNEDKYKEVASALEEASNTWYLQGPVNRRNFEATKPELLPSVVKECFNLLQSEAVFLILSQLTGLTLHSLAVSDSEDEEDIDHNSQGSSSEPKSKRIKSEENIAKKIHNSQGSSSEPKSKHIKSEESIAKKIRTDEVVDAKCYCEVRRWSHGFYTLLNDNDDELSEFVLDATLFFNCKDWQNDYGGYMTYVAKDEDDELLTVYPHENALALVFRDKETVRFVKHINHRSTVLGSAAHFHTISSVYFE